MLAQPRQQGPACRIRQRRERAIQWGCLILNHVVKYGDANERCQVRNAMRVDCSLSTRVAVVWPEMTEPLVQREPEMR